jgi:glycosyltransferase involved in cell wall biosynthesis
MKIVFTEDDIYAYATGKTSSGAGRWQWLLARALVADGWSVTAGVREGMGAGERRGIDGVEFLGIGQSQFLLAWYRFLSSERPQWWYWHTAEHVWGLAVEVAKLLGVGTIFSTAFDRDVQPRRALSRRRRWWPLYAWGLARTDKILVQHGGQLSALAPRWRSKAYIFPGVVGDMAAVKPHAGRANHVAWVAMLRQPKRPDLLIQIAQKAPSLHFVVCGGATRHRSPPGYGERFIQAMQRLPNIEFLGEITPEKALQVIADAALLLLTSDEEGFPNTFLEAWSSGTPVVTLKIDPDRIIERAGLGAVSGNVGQAIVDMKALMDSPEQRDEIGARARLYIAQTHSAAAVATLFNRVIRDPGL